MHCKPLEIRMNPLKRMCGACRILRKRARMHLSFHTTFTHQRIFRDFDRSWKISCTRFEFLKHLFPRMSKSSMPEIVIIPVHGFVCGQLTPSGDLQFDPIDRIGKQSGQSYYFYFASLSLNKLKGALISLDLHVAFEKCNTLSVC